MLKFQPYSSSFSLTTNFLCFLGILIFSLFFLFIHLTRPTYNYLFVPLGSSSIYICTSKGNLGNAHCLNGSFLPRRFVSGSIVNCLVQATDCLLSTWEFLGFGQASQLLAPQRLTGYSLFQFFPILSFLFPYSFLELLLTSYI